MFQSSLFRGSAFGVMVATLLLWLISSIDLFQNHVSLPNTALYLLIGLTITSFIGFCALIIFFLIQPLSSLYKWALACFIFSIYYFFIPPVSTFGMTILSIWILSAFSLTGASLAALFNHSKQNKSTYLYLFSGLISIVMLSVWLFINFNTFHYKPADPFEKPLITPLNAPNPSLNGPFQVNHIFYGSGTDLRRHEYRENVTIKTPSVNGFSFINGWEGLNGWLRTKYWGFDSSQLPLNGTVFYPTGDGPFPLVLIVHGNHEMSTPSETGYDYLGKLWASRGFITVSIDENFLNSGFVDDLFDGIFESPARGWLILEHLSLWREWNQTKNHLFYQKIDLNNIALIGHSRGGEAIATATAFNKLSRYPGNGNILFNYQFNIKALGAIAPVEAQYTPGGSKIELSNVNYFVIQGSDDGDLRSFLGYAQYHRILFNDSQDHFKGNLYVVRANHGQFNSMWGKNDTVSPAAILFDTGRLMSDLEQQLIAKIYLTALLEISLHDKKEYLPLFIHSKAGSNWLPSTIYLNEFADSTYQYLIGRKKTIDITAATLENGHLLGENLSKWSQNKIFLKDGTAVDTGIFLGWNAISLNQAPGTYTITLPEKKLKITPLSILTFSLADASNIMMENAAPIDFTIELTDEVGQQSSLLLSSYAPLQPASYSCFMKASFLDQYCKVDHIFQTFEFPLSHFVTVNPSFNSEKLKKIRLIFNISKEGNIILNDVALHN